VVIGTAGATGQGNEEEPMKPAPMLLTILMSLSLAACAVDDELGEDSLAVEEEGGSMCPLAGPEGRLLSLGTTEWTIIEPPEDGEPFAIEEPRSAGMVFDPLRGTCVAADVAGTPVQPEPTNKPKKVTCTWEESSDCGWKMVDGTKVCGPTKMKTHTKEETKCGHEHPPHKTTTCSPSGSQCLQTTKITSVCS
jgi:hypothetical protein